MQFIKTFQLYDFFDTLVCLLVAFVFGTLIGAERRYRQPNAGLQPEGMLFRIMLNARCACRFRRT